MANKVKCPSGYILNGKGECVPISLSRPPTPLPLSTVKNNKSDTIVKKTTKKAVMSKDEFRDKKTAINQAKKLEDLQNGVPSRAGRVTKEIISGIGAAAAAGVGIKSLFSKSPSNSIYNPDFKNGGKATNKKVNIMAVVKKKAAPKKKVAPVKGAWVPPWAKKAVTEKKTGEKYPSKVAMAKHEKGESKKVRKAEGEIPKARNGGKTCSCGKASCMMCGGKHKIEKGGKKFGDGGKAIKSDTISKPNTNKQKFTFNIPPMTPPPQAPETMQKSRAPEKPKVEKIGFKNGGKRVTSKMVKSGKKC